MAQSGSDIMAQAVFLAQLKAAQGKCECEVCRILRKATDQMAMAFLGGPAQPARPPAPAAETVHLDLAEGGV
jgi:hypothetical protein